MATGAMHGISPDAANEHASNDVQRVSADSQQPNNKPSTGLEHRSITGLGRNSLWRYLTLLVSSAEGLLVAGIALRRLGTSEYGAFALIAAAIGLIGTIDFALSFSVTRSVARDNDRFSEDDRHRARTDVAVAHATYAACGIGGVAATGLILWVLPLFRGSSGVGIADDRLTILLVGLSMAFYLGTAVLEGIPAGRNRFSVTAMGVSLGAVANVAFVVITIHHLHLVALGGGQLIGVVITRIVGAQWVRRNEPWFRFVPRKARRSELRRVMVFALPLLVISVGGQIVATSDLVVIGAFSAAASVALYRVGSLAPSQLIAAVYTGFDGVFPSLSSSSSNKAQEADIAFLTKIVCFATGIAFGALVMLRTDVVTIIMGHSTGLATTVLILFCATWVANTPVHGISLVLVARGRQKTFIPLVTAELVANLVLTIIFVAAFGPIGAAVATLGTIVVSNDLLFPLVVRKELEISAFRIVWEIGFVAIACGAIVAVCSVLPVSNMHPGVARFFAGGGISLVVGTLTGIFLLGQSGRKRFARMLRKTDDGAVGVDSVLPIEGVP
ncbi:MAG: oligosaccharide flippase family protein [Acidimicrobiales bacterium]